MSFLDLYQGDVDQAAKIQPNEGTRLPSGFDENFSAAWSDGRLFGQSIARQNARADVLSDYLDEVRTKTGNDLRAIDVQGEQGSVDNIFAMANDRVAKIKESYPEIDLAPLTDDEIDKRAVAKAQAAHRNYEALQAGEKGPGGSIGSFLGGAANSATDPINIVGLAIAPETGGVSILGAALRWGALAGVSQAAIEATSASFKQEVQPDYGVGDALGNVAGATVGGAVLGGSFKALGNLWTRAKTGAWPTSVRDAGNVIESHANVASTNILPGVEGEVAHHEALTKAIDDIFAGRPVEVQDQLFSQPRVNEKGEPLDMFAAHEARLDQLMGERAFVRGTADAAREKIEAGLQVEQPELPFEPTALQASAEQHAAQLANGIVELARSRGYEMSGEDATAIAERVAKMPDDQSARAILDQVVLNPSQIADHLPEIPKVTRAPEAAAPQPPLQTPAEMAKTLTAPDHQDAIRADIDRERAMGDVKVPGVDEQGNHTMVSVDAAMDQVDAYKAAAEHIQACANPMTEAAE